MSLIEVDHILLSVASPALSQRDDESTDIASYLSRSRTG
jgi:hypothetical protein